MFCFKNFNKKRRCEGTRYEQRKAFIIKLLKKNLRKQIKLFSGQKEEPTFSSICIIYIAVRFFTRITTLLTTNSTTILEAVYEFM